jgi:hypothetical protein
LLLVTFGQVVWDHFHRPAPDTVQCHNCFWTGPAAWWESAGGCPRCRQSGDYSYLLLGPGQVPTGPDGPRRGPRSYRHRRRL